jgi:hypothetical protein
MIALTVTHSLFGKYDFSPQMTTSSVRTENPTVSPERERREALQWFITQMTTSSVRTENPTVSPERGRLEAVVYYANDYIVCADRVLPLVQREEEGSSGLLKNDLS